LTAEARLLIENFARDMQQRQTDAEPMLAAALGKARGQALRLALVLELLWWCGEDSALPPPFRISPRSLSAAVLLICDYFMAMAARVYADSGARSAAAILAHWIITERPLELHVRHLQRCVRLPGLRTAREIREAADLLASRGWLRPPERRAQFSGRVRIVYAVNPQLGYAHPTVEEVQTAWGSPM
jgi:uncharacterized protein DUF3987